MRITWKLSVCDGASLPDAVPTEPGKYLYPLIFRDLHSCGSLGFDAPIHGNRDRA
jgi:hypothetical protein